MFCYYVLASEGSSLLSSSPPWASLAPPFIHLYDGRRWNHISNFSINKYLHFNPFKTFSSFIPTKILWNTLKLNNEHCSYKSSLFIFLWPYDNFLGFYNNIPYQWIVLSSKKRFSKLIFMFNGTLKITAKLYSSFKFGWYIFRWNLMM